MFDQRMGQSVTLTGRSITKHMISTVNKEITGEYDVEGEAIVYSDKMMSLYKSNFVE